MIEVGRLHFTAIASEVGIAHIINQNEDDVGP
jgi:hypothetical protein